MAKIEPIAIKYFIRFVDGTDLEATVSNDPYDFSDSLHNGVQFVELISDSFKTGDKMGMLYSNGRLVINAQTIIHFHFLEIYAEPESKKAKK